MGCRCRHRARTGRRWSHRFRADDDPGATGARRGRHPGARGRWHLRWPRSRGPTGRRRVGRRDGYPVLDDQGQRSRRCRERPLFASKRDRHGGDPSDRRRAAARHPHPADRQAREGQGACAAQSGGQRAAVPQDDRHVVCRPAQRRLGDEEGPRPLVGTDGDGGQCPDDDQGRNRRRSSRSRHLADGPGSGRDRRSADLPRSSSTASLRRRSSSSTASADRSDPSWT